MPPVSGHKRLAEAVYTSISEGTFSADQDVASAELSSTALQGLSKLLEQARIDVKNSISELSRLSAADIDGWITQAKQLRSDIVQSERQSQDIVRSAEAGQELREQAKDALKTTQLRQVEVDFNESLVDTLKEVITVKRVTDDAEKRLRDGQVLEATKIVISAENQVRGLSHCSGTNLVKIIEGRLEKIRSSIIDTVNEIWSRTIRVDASTLSITILSQIQHDDTRQQDIIPLQEITQTLDALDLLQRHISLLIQSIDQTILSNLIQPHSSVIRVKSNAPSSVALVKSEQVTSSTALFEDIQILQGYFKERLPKNCRDSFITKLNVALVDRLLSNTLVSAVPLDISGMETYRETISQVREFARSLDRNSTGSRQRLNDWADDAPNLWLAKRSQSSLNSIRQLFKRGLGRSRQVERVETQVVKHDDEMFAGNGEQEDWDAGWSDEGNEPQQAVAEANHAAATQSNGTNPKDEDEDVSGWGFDDEDDQIKSPVPTGSFEQSTSITEGPSNHNDDDDEGEAWGWGDDAESPEELKSPVSRQQPNIQAPARTPKTPRAGSRPETREVTLRESYHISALPEQILEIITMVVEDADLLSMSSDTSPVASSIPGLYALSSSLLAMFRASAPSFYASDINGSMFLYNDCLYISESLGFFIKSHDSRYPGDRLTNIRTIDLPRLETFGKRAYGKDMESKRTTLVDLLDGAQGFSNSTQEPFASQCDLAVSSVIDFLGQIHTQWMTVLSRSALLQSMGSLLGTITNKIIIDIEDMGDISEPESQRLVSFCKSITSLENMFLPDVSEGATEDEQAIPLTAAYCKTWLRFQYLSNILDSSLADIKYMWTEGGLSYEFTVDEVVDLIEALFADSDHRRRAISEIRHGR